MIVTTWYVIDKETGEVSASARRPSDERWRALQRDGHRTFVRNVRLDYEPGEKLDTGDAPTYTVETCSAQSLCEHPNEVPAVCPCGPRCYCKFHSCDSLL